MSNIHHVILNQSLLKPRINQSSLYQYCLASRVSIANEVSGTVVENGHVYVKMNIVMHPLANVVVIECQTASPFVNVEDIDSRGSIRRVQLPSRYVSVCAYFD
jgi:hypothetical protein